MSQDSSTTHTMHTPPPVMETVGAREQEWPEWGPCLPGDHSLVRRAHPGQAGFYRDVDSARIGTDVQRQERLSHENSDSAD